MPHRLDALNDLEHALVETARTGEKLVCPGADGEAIRAQVIRELLLGRYGPVDSRGIRVAGARITGVLDLDNVTACAGAMLTGCLFAEPVSAWNAHLPWLDLSRSWFPGFRGDLVDVEADLWLTGAVIVGSGKGGAVALHGARIGGSLDLGGSFRGAVQLSVRTSGATSR